MTSVSEAAPGRAPDRKPRAKRWAELIDAAAEIFYEKGYDAASLQDIADRVGILKGSIYYYIETKADLLNHVLQEVHSSGMTMIRGFAAQGDDAVERLMLMISGHVEYICRNLGRTTVYLHELKKLDDAQRNKLFGNHEFRDEFLHVIEQGQREGTFRTELDAKLTSQAMLASLNSLYQWYRPNRGKPAQVVARHFADITLRGIVTAKGLKRIEELQ